MKLMTCIAAAAVSIVTLQGQWLNYPTPGIPRTADGKPNLSAPAPRMPDGKPDLSGLARRSKRQRRSRKSDRRNRAAALGGCAVEETQGRTV